MHHSYPLLTKEVLEDLYVNQKLSSTNIAAQFGCHLKTVLNYLRRYGFSVRPSNQCDDLTGKQFGWLTVVSVYKRTPKEMRAKHPFLWTCRCKCGNSTKVETSRLLGGFTNSCGCLNREGKVDNIIGQRFGHLTVIDRDGDFPSSVRWLCRCDCGKMVSALSRKLKMGKKRSCGDRHHIIGANSASWKGGKHTNPYGYVMVHVIGTRKYRLEHRLVMERILGRPLLKSENIHHKNGVRHDNRPENLELWTKCQPPGKRAIDMVSYAVEILKRYAPEKLVSKGRSLQSFLDKGAQRC